MGTNKEKQELRSSDAEQRQKASDDAVLVGNAEADAAEASPSGKKSKKKKKPYEEPEERRKRIAKERFLQKKAATKAEREQEFRKQRASARRSRKSIRPGKGFEDVAPKQKKKKNKG